MITVNSYKVYEGVDPMLFNTFYIKRTKEHSNAQSVSKNKALKIMQNGSMYIVHDNITYNAIGQMISSERE